MTFEEAAYYFSTDKKTRNNGGLFADPQTSEARIARPDIPGDMAREVNKMKPAKSLSRSSVIPTAKKNTRS